MRKLPTRPARLVVGLLIGALLGFPPALGARPADDDPLAQVERLDHLRQRIAEVQQQIRAAQGQQSELNRQLEASEERIGRLTRRQRVLAVKLERQQIRLDELHDQQRQQQLTLDGEREGLRNQVRAAYAMGRQEQLKILLNQQDPALLSRVLAYYDYLNRARLQRMQIINQRLQELARTRAEITFERAQLVETQQLREQEKATLEEEQVARRGVLANLDNEILDQDQQLQRLRDDERHLQSLLENLQEAMAEVRPQPAQRETFAQAKGRLAWPARGNLAHAFGEPKIGGLRWEGVLIQANLGEEVRAVHTGQVVFADWLRGFGLLLIVDHGEGYMTLYGHNQSLFKEVGDWVESGEPIATVGASGGRSEVGIYFAIRSNGKPLDPVVWCERARGARVGARVQDTCAVRSIDCFAAGARIGYR